MSQFPIFASDLSAEDQQKIKQSIDRLGKLFSACQTRLISYQADDAREKSDSALKLINNLKEASAACAAMVDELTEKHQLHDPDLSLRNIETMRDDMRNFLTGKPVGEMGA